MILETTYSIATALLNALEETILLDDLKVDPTEIKYPNVESSRLYFGCVYS